MNLKRLTVWLFLIPLFMLSVLAIAGTREQKVVLIADEMKTEKQLDRGVEPYRLAGFVLDHFHYNYAKAGQCQNITKCISDLEKRGYFEGVCDDVTRVFIYLFIKAGYGDPLYVIVDTDEGLHAESVWADKDFCIQVFFGIPGTIKEVHWGSEIVGLDAQRTEKDIFAYNIVKNIGIVTGCPDEIASKVNGYAGKKGSTVYVHVTGIGNESTDCTIAKKEKSCFSADFYVFVDKDVCHIDYGGKRIWIIREP